MEGRRLFRSEPESARANSWLGRILLIRPLSFTLLSIAALVLAFALGAFFTFGEYTRKARVTGVLAPIHGVVRIVALQPGMVVASYVREGEAVESDAPLFAISDTRANRATEDFGAAYATRAEARRRALERQRHHTLRAFEAEHASFVQRRAALGRELELIDEEIDTHTRRFALSSQGVDRARALETIGFLSPAAREREQEASLEQAARVEAARRTRLSLQREIAAIEYEMASARSRAQTQLAGLDVQAATLEQERLDRDVQFHSTMVAPIGGTVASVLVEPGQMVSAGTTLATLIPIDARLEAHLYTPSRSIGFVRDGQEVLLRFLAYPHQKFWSHRARVVAISKNPLQPAELGFSPADGSREPVYRIKAELDEQAIRAYGVAQPLQAGMQLEADVLLDRRRLIEWIFEPLLSLAGRA
jgi:membrane fusion protein